jgi:hypothetical protein
VDSAGVSQTRSPVVVHAPPERVLHAFFDPYDLAKWWQVVRSVTIPRPLGTYAVEWASTGYRDDQLGRLGGAFHGTMIGKVPAPIPQASQCFSGVAQMSRRYWHEFAGFWANCCLNVAICRVLLQQPV